ncbi:MAG: ATP-binding protein, partial [Myxococcota bacterium]
MSSPTERVFTRILGTRPSAYPYVAFWLGIMTSWLAALLGFYFIYLTIDVPPDRLVEVLVVLLSLLLVVTIVHRLMRRPQLERMSLLAVQPPGKDWDPETAADLRMVLSFPGSFARGVFAYAEVVVLLFLAASLLLFGDVSPGAFQIAILVGGQMATAAAVLISYSVMEVALMPLKSLFAPIEDPELIARLPNIAGYKARVFAGMMVLFFVTAILVGSLVYQDYRALHPMAPDLSLAELAPELLEIGLLTLAFGTVLALTASGIASRLIENSLETLKRLGAGDLSARATVPSAGDLGILSANVNLMARRMQETITDLQESRRALEQAEERRAALVENLTHDIRSPISTIMASSELGETEARGLSAESLERHFLLIRRNAKRVADLATNIMDMEQLERSELQLEVGFVDLRQIANELVSSMASLIGDRPLTLRANVPDSLEPFLSDPVKLTRILDNLLANALRVTRQGKIEVGAAISPDNKLSISVSDTGPGIPPESLELIFEPRSRVAGVPRGGAGLGLTISRKFAALLGG